MNRRNLLKGISYLAAALSIPFRFFVKTKNPPRILIYVEGQPSDYPEDPEDILAAIAKTVCVKCNKTFREHSQQELVSCDNPSIRFVFNDREANIDWPPAS